MKKEFASNTSSETNDGEAGHEPPNRLLADKARWLSSTLEHLDQGISIFDSNLNSVYFNKRFLELLDFPLDWFQHEMPFDAFIRYNAERGEYGPGDPEDQTRERVALASKFLPHRFERVKTDGTVLEIVGNVMDGDGFVTTYTDITAHKRAVQAFRNSEEKFRALYDDNPSMFFTLDIKGKILSTNRFGAKQIGYPVEELIGKTIFDLSPESENASLQEHLRDCLDKPDAIRRWEVVKNCKNGSQMWVREVARVVSNPDGDQHILTVCEDITDARKLSEQLNYQASHDPLTGLANRWAFEKRLEKSLLRVDQSKSGHALCYLDLDQFKIINDSCGHAAGDELLRQLGVLLPQHVRENDTLARLGGDEFGVLLENCNLERALKIANDLRETVEKFRFAWNDRAFGLGASIGLVPVTSKEQDLASILSAADAACYVAKDSGRNRIHIYHEEDSILAARKGQIQWLNRTRRALEEGRFCLYFQEISSGESSLPGSHYEVLVRMIDRNEGIIPPGAFMSAAERYDLMPRLDRWVVNETLTKLGAHPNHLSELSQCAINLSGQSLSDDGFAEFVIQSLESNSIPADKICFEITETAAIGNLPGAIQFITVLKSLGCQFALDDFGSGMSSFAYLKNLPVDYLKIDGVFIKDMMEDPINLALVKSINSIGHVMGKVTIAEFVETIEIRDCLIELGVDYLQGYYIAKPEPYEQLLNKS